MRIERFENIFIIINQIKNCPRILDQDKEKAINEIRWLLKNRPHVYSGVIPPQNSGAINLDAKYLSALFIWRNNKLGDDFWGNIAHNIGWWLTTY